VRDLAAYRFGRHWRWWVVLIWLAAAALMIWDRGNLIRWFGLGDTDDNLRMMQVRALLAGQDWFDLRQYRLDPPGGADIHWSRIVDLPIAGLMLLFRLFVSGAVAERWAVAIAPLLPMLVTFLAIGGTARRLIGPGAFALAVGLVLCAHSTRGMFMPLRIDHHGWQLAALSLVVLGLADPKARRGGLTAGLASAFSLAIGLEMLIYLAVAGAAVALLWVRDRAEAPRLGAYGVSLGAGSALGFLLFASHANRQPVCDALSPVWLSVMLAAGAAALLLSRLRAERWPVRLALAAVAGAAVAGFYALAWPHCLSRLEGVGPELEAMWLSRVREARPIYTHDWPVMIAVLPIVLSGLVGYGLTLWRQRLHPAEFARWVAVAAPALVAALLLLWQTRAGPAAQLLAVPGAAALAWFLIGKAQALESLLPRVAGTVLAFYLASGLIVQHLYNLKPAPPPSPRNQAVNQANARCPTLAALRPIAQQPRGYVLTHVDLGPRLITVTHHRAVAGPYHRNERAILDVMKAFRGTPDNARATVQRLGIDYVLICPGLSETTVYAAEAPKGFYVQLRDGRVPAWLRPISLPGNSPYKMWRVVRPGSRTQP
jgi:hypothetical protein